MPAKAGVAPTGVILYFSIAKLPNLVLDQSPGSAGKLIHAADARHIFAVDLRGGTGAAVLAHKNGRHPHPLPLQGAHLRGGIGNTGGVLVGAAQRVLCCGRNAAAVVGRCV